MKHLSASYIVGFTFVIIFSIGIQSCSRTVKGNVYVTMKNHDTKRLASTKVYIVPESTVLEWVKKAQSYESVQARVENIRVRTNPEENERCEWLFSNALKTIQSSAISILETDVSGQFILGNAPKERLFFFATYVTENVERMILVQRLQPDRDLIELNNTRSIFRQTYGQNEGDQRITALSEQLLSIATDLKTIERAKKSIIDHSPAWKPNNENDFLELQNLFFFK